MINLTDSEIGYIIMLIVIVVLSSIITFQEIKIKMIHKIYQDKLKFICNIKPDDMVSLNYEHPKVKEIINKGD